LQVSKIVFISLFINPLKQEKMKRLVLVVAAAVCMTGSSISAGSTANTGTREAGTGFVQSGNLQEEHKTLKVQGSCGMCKTRIEKAAKGVAGVASATWNQKTKVLELNFDSKKTTLEAISNAIAKTGHDTDKHKADDKTYNGLPGCCKYRK
jgi:Cu(I)/Ag(I) efflux system membrane fusion protein